MHELEHEFTERKVSPWGGIKFFQQTFVRTQIRAHLLSLDLPNPGSNRGYPAIDLIEGFLTSVVLGSRRLEHSGMLRTDNVIREIFGWSKGMCSASTFQRFLHRFDKERIAKIFPSVLKFMLSQQAVRYMTIDLDGSVLTRYGTQEGALIGYNPQKRGRPSHHPIMAFCEETKMVVNGWMRSGNTSSSSDAVAFLEETFKIVEPDNIGLVRADVGFYSHEIMSLCESSPRPIPYLIKARMTTGVYKSIVEPRNWSPSDDIVTGAIYTEIEYKSSGWKMPRRLILVGTPRRGKSNPASSLFQEYAITELYEFCGFMTNTEMSMIEVHRRYNQRGDAENRIKELKYDFAIDGFAMHSISATETAFRFALLAYNIMQIFKKEVLKPKVNSRLSTLKFQCIAIGSYLVTKGRKKVMKLSAEGKRRHFLEHIFENVEEFCPVFTVP